METNNILPATDETVRHMPSATECFVCDTAINFTTAGYSQLPCGHVCHLRCLTVGLHHYFDDDLDMQCKGCILKGQKSRITNDDISGDDAAHMMEHKLREKHKKYSLKEMTASCFTEQEIADIKKYCDVTKLCIKQDKIANRIANAKAKEFKKEVAPIIFSVNKIMRKHYADLRKNEYCKLLIKHAQKHRRLYDNLHNISAKYSEQFNTRFGTDEMIKFLDLPVPGYFSSYIYHNDSYKHKFRIDKELYNTKGLLKKINYTA